MALHVPEPEDFVNGVSPDPDHESEQCDQLFNVIVACLLNQRTVEDALATLINPVDHLFVVEGTNPRVVHQFGNVTIAGTLNILNYLYSKVPYDHPGQRKLARF